MKAGTENIGALNGIAGRRPENGITYIPEHMGTGYIKGYMLQLRLVVRQYELYKEWLLDRGLGEDEKKFVMIAFHNAYR